MQLVLLEKLAAAIEDDDVIDFSDLTDASDRAQTQAIKAISEFFLRKQEEEIGRTVIHQLEVTHIQESSSAPTTKAVSAIAPTPIRTVSDWPKGSAGSTQNSPQNAFSRTMTDPTTRSTRLPSASQLPSRPPPVRPQLDTQARIIRSPPVESNQGGINTKRDSDTSIPSTRSVVSAQSSPANVSRRESQSSYDTAAPKYRLVSEGSGTPIQSYGGTCKYAHAMREGKTGVWLEGRDLSRLGKERFVYSCKSIKCNFEGMAIPQKAKRRWQNDVWIMDNRVRTLHGVDYKWAFLAKSHIQQAEASVPQYRCLVCLLIHQTSAQHDREALFEHLSAHRAEHVGNVKLEGSLKFANQGIIAHEDFDICLRPSDGTAYPLSRSTTDATYVDYDVGAVSPDTDSVLTSKSHWSEDVEESTLAWQNS